METNELRVNFSGVWIKAPAEDIQVWMEIIIEICKRNGYRLLWLKNLKNSMQLSLQKEMASLIVNVFINGKIQFICTDNMKELLKSLLPQLEIDLGVVFKQTNLEDSGSQRTINNIKFTTLKNGCFQTPNPTTSTAPSTPTLISPGTTTTRSATTVVATPKRKPSKDASTKTEFVDTNVEELHAGIKELLKVTAMQHNEFIDLKKIVKRSQEEILLLRTDIIGLKTELARYKIDSVLRKNSAETPSAATSDVSKTKDVENGDEVVHLIRLEVARQIREIYKSVNFDIGRKCLREK